MEVAQRSLGLLVTVTGRMTEPACLARIASATAEVTLCCTTSTRERLPRPFGLKILAHRAKSTARQWWRLRRSMQGGSASRFDACRGSQRACEALSKTEESWVCLFEPPDSTKSLSPANLPKPPVFSRADGTLRRPPGKRCCFTTAKPHTAAPNYAAQRRATPGLNWHSDQLKRDLSFPNRSYPGRQSRGRHGAQLRAPLALRRGALLEWPIRQCLLGGLDWAVALPLQISESWWTSLFGMAGIKSPVQFCVTVARKAVGTLQVVPDCIILPICSVTP